MCVGGELGVTHAFNPSFCFWNLPRYLCMLESVFFLKCGLPTICIRITLKTEGLFQHFTPYSGHSNL